LLVHCDAARRHQPADGLLECGAVHWSVKVHIDREICMHKCAENTTGRHKSTRTTYSRPRRRGNTRRRSAAAGSESFL
jgi:hypothetical protein